MSGIYLHIPFCKQACFYCDFHFSTSLKKKEELISCLIKELEIRKAALEHETIETIYFGGGTPSLLSVSELERLIKTIYANYKVAGNPEITLEANPDDLMSIGAQSGAIFKEYKEIGINRLSIGVQSFFEEDLKMMNRAHNAEEAIESIKMARYYFDNITVDLIYGIPHMTSEKWMKNLQTVFDLGIPHISSYALTVEPNTALDSFIKKGKYPPLDEALAKEHFDILVSETRKNGFIQYEISNFGKPDYFSKHNTSYWLGKKYLGIGPSAHSFNKTHRSWNVSNNSKYIQSILENGLPSETEKLSKKDQFNEAIMTGLRTIWGVSLAEIEANFGLDYKTQLLASATQFIQQELLVITKETKQSFHVQELTSLIPPSNDIEILKTTEKGKFLADGLASELFRI